MIETRSIASTLHLLSCEKKHMSEHSEAILIAPGAVDGDDCCYWYMEDQMDTCWEEADHKEYFEKAEKLISLLGSEERAKTAMNSFMEIAQKISFASNNFREARGVLAEILVNAMR